jgi:hypothetical protein
MKFNFFSLEEDNNIKEAKENRSVNSPSTSGLDGQKMQKKKAIKQIFIISHS